MPDGLVGTIEQKYIFSRSLDLDAESKFSLIL
jgi:hypothetical protein